MGTTLSTIAHLSDLHFGSGRKNTRTAFALARSIIAERIDHVIITGDLTHRGRRKEWEAYLEAFEPLIARNMVTVVPGNHDRLGDDVAAHMMPPGIRVCAESRPGLYIIRVDSTGPHNRRLLGAHGMLTDTDLDHIELLLAGARDDQLCAVALHHHPMPLREEHLHERFSTMMGWPYATELSAGPRLLERLRGRADLLLHGHRHHPAQMTLDRHGPRPLHIINAGSSVQLQSMRVYAHRGPELHGELSMPRPLPPVHPMRFVARSWSSGIRARRMLMRIGE